MRETDPAAARNGYPLRSRRLMKSLVSDPGRSRRAKRIDAGNGLVATRTYGDDLHRYADQGLDALHLVLCCAGKIFIASAAADIFIPAG